MRLRGKNRRHHRHPRRPLRRFMLHCHLPCVRAHYADSDSGSDIQRDSLLDGDLQPSVVGASWEEPQTPWDAPAPWTQPPLPTQPVTETTMDTHHTGNTNFHQNPLLMREEASEPAGSIRADSERGSAEEVQEEVADRGCPDGETGERVERMEREGEAQPTTEPPEELQGAMGGQEDPTDPPTGQFQDVRFTFNRQFHMGSSHQYRLWKDVYGQHRHDTLPRRSVSESGSEDAAYNTEQPENTGHMGVTMENTGHMGVTMENTGHMGVTMENTGHMGATMEILDARDEPIPLNNCTDTDQLSTGEPWFRSALSLPSLSHSSCEDQEVFDQVPNCVVHNHHRSFERNWTNLMAGCRDDIFAVCTNPALVRSDNNTLSSLGSLGQSGGRPTRSSSLNNLDAIMDNFSMGTDSSGNSLGHPARMPSREGTLNTFGHLFAVSNRLAGLTRQGRDEVEDTVESTRGTMRVTGRDPIQLLSLFNPNPQPPRTSTTDTMLSNSTNSNTNSTRSSNSAPRNVQQNWYVYDPRLLAGVGGREGSRLTMETNYRGVRQHWSMPGIIAPPTYDEAVTGTAATDLPPPYPDSVSTLSSIGPPSDSEGIPLDLNHDPPPPYEPPAEASQCVSQPLSPPNQDMIALNPPPGDQVEQSRNDVTADNRGSDNGSNEDAINEELDSILEEEVASQSGSIGEIGEMGHGFFMNSDSGNTRISSFGGAITGIGFGAARPPVRWNRGMGLDRWACTSNWVSS